MSLETYSTVKKCISPTLTSVSNNNIFYLAKVGFCVKEASFLMGTCTFFSTDHFISTKRVCIYTCKHIHLALPREQFNNTESFSFSQQNFIYPFSLCINNLIYSEQVRTAHRTMHVNYMPFRESVRENQMVGIEFG